MYKKDKVLTEVASKRLRAIKEFTEFGSGFRVAMKDLEIRGAGNILGTEQSGHMMQIGYELYCKLMDDAVRKLRGEKVADSEMEVSIEIKVDAFISGDYIKDEKLRLDMYKRIADIRSQEDIADVTEELEDRFGKVPGETVSLMYVACIQALCRQAGIKRVALDGEKVLFEFDAEINGLTAERIAQLTEAYGSSLLVGLGKRPYIRMPFTSRSKLLPEITELLSVFEEKKQPPAPDPAEERPAMRDEDFLFDRSMFFMS